MAEPTREADDMPEVQDAILGQAKVSERFWSKVTKRGKDECWLWTGSTNLKGYGVFRYKQRNYMAHRLTYELLVGSIPEALTLDHLCRNHPCTNPDHLEPISNKDNILRGMGRAALNARKTHCLKGHPFDLLNTYIRAKGRGCRICRVERAK